LLAKEQMAAEHNVHFCIHGWCRVEPAMHNVIVALFPDARIDCCSFHLGQAWWRNIQRIGLSSEYKDKSGEISKLAKEQMAAEHNVHFCIHGWCKVGERTSYNT
jgi:hypothetical protein